MIETLFARRMVVLLLWGIGSALNIKFHVPSIHSYLILKG
jgi:hypothetical protein